MPNTFMFTQLKSKKTEVAISKGTTPKESLLKGINYFGGISNFVSEGDHVFIKFNLCLPGGFSTNINFDILQALIVLCKEAGAKRVSLGSYPPKGISINMISNILNLEEYFQTLEAELAFLDNSDIFKTKKIKQDQLKKIKYNSHTKVEIKDKEFLVPNIILNSDKFISVNQVNVNPLFQLNSSVLNQYSIIPAFYQEIGKRNQDNTEYLSRDQYKKELVSKIFDVFTIKQPNLVINDLFYILEGAGPYVYKDSRLKKTGLILLGGNAISVDLITLDALNININTSELIREAQNKNMVIPKISDIKILGEKIEDIRTNIKLCASKLEDLRIRNVSINSGNYCSGCFRNAYHLLNFMKTYMDKDLKYNNINSLVIGENPTEPEKRGNIILFGDCAINSTMDYNFRKINTKSKKDLTYKTKIKNKKKSKSNKNLKVKEKSNKNILNLYGCPPDFFDCLESIKTYYKKKNLPNLNFFLNMNKLWRSRESIDKLNIWEAL
ncbi:MAG: DUF362 domain-containing protein [Candidatus Odinarchaeota archaeon]